jgi:hypothetical protein
MQNKILWFAVIVFLCAASYKIGRSIGFDQGWDKGFQRGLDNPEYTEATK